MRQAPTKASPGKSGKPKLTRSAYRKHQREAAIQKFPNTGLNKYSVHTKVRKQRLIHNAQVKKEFFKKVAPETTDDTPDYIREIFSKGTDPDTGDLLSHPAKNEENPKGNKEYTAKRTPESDTHSFRKPNPFQRALADRAEEKRQREIAREEREKERAQGMEKRTQYYKQRKQEYRTMTQRNKRGQLKLSNQVDVLLKRLQ
ncbi:hypothetical protein IWQ62_005894 [Dispira parvispora]|uniref:rRNA-processing protein FYV7 n=1 Tax=Dispira parvispora TaxID=1520584 RepID=A0A9W8APJ9_9FUNG|nr:hypothetical protein IWQ62_005894 [Dispira parvispora]